MSDDEVMSASSSDLGGFDDDDASMLDDFNDDDNSSVDDSGFEVASSEKSKAHQIDFKVLSVKELEERQKADAESVASILAIQPSECVILLRHWGWNKDKLLEQYMEDPDRCNADAGLETGRQPRLKRMRGFTCDVCFDEDGSKETLALSCDHRYCKECYTQYLNQKVADGESKRIQCMGSKCPLIVDEKTVDLLVDTETSEKYKRLLNRAYVDDNPALRWCPGPDCQLAIECHVPVKSLDAIVPSVKCDCGHAFCFGCGLTEHQPCICPLVKKWLQKCKDDSETANWISANTKECPKCQSTIEKNGGCNHMTCKKCKYEFCWVCMGLWTDHGTSWYNCNRYNEKEPPGADAQSQSRASLERYLHYYNRYANHELSAKLEKDLYVRIEKKMNEIQEVANMSWIEVQFMKKAVETLSDCRGTLKWSYGLAYFMERNNMSELFEQNQSNLEMAVEALSELIEKPIEPETIPELREQVTNKSVYVHSRHQVMLEDTAKGTLDHRWEFTVSGTK